MANYIATTRSNYFRVTDAKAFEQQCGVLGLERWTKEIEGETFYAITSDSDGWPSQAFNEDTGDYDFFELSEALKPHLDSRDVIILLEIGFEKLRYVVGMATAIHATLPAVHLSLRDIEEKARVAYGPDVTITEASY